MSKKIQSQAPQEPRELATSNVLNMSELAENARENMFKTEILRLEKHNVGLGTTVDQLLKSIEDKDAEIVHLKKLLLGGNDTLGLSKVLVSDEEALIDIQIRKLKESCQFREMTLDEVKRLDLLIKNKRLLQADAPPAKPASALPRDVSPTDLLSIASKRITEE